jgi:hypothetical protein
MGSEGNLEKKDYIPKMASQFARLGSAAHRRRHGALLAILRSGCLCVLSGGSTLAFLHAYTNYDVSSCLSGDLRKASASAVVTSFQGNAWYQLCQG